jgi:FtsP/CotA-like multicopper oxidase with cupredoxin domain/plastocyanin
MKRGRHDFVVGNRRLFGSRGAIAGAVFSVVILVALNVWGLIPPVTGNASPQTRTFTLTAEEIDWELQPGNMVRAWAYNGQVPGPEIRVREGDRVQITLVNHLPVATTIHWHGVNVTPDMDGPAGLNQAPVEPGQTFVYDFIARPAGTRWYHAHTDVASQVMLGLYGSFIVEPRDGGITVDRDYTYILSEWDNELTPDVATGNAPRGPRDALLRGGEFGTDEFLMNGKMHEAIPPILVKEGDRVLLRMINAGTLAHPFHTHGHSFKIVATDGNPVPEAAQLTKDTVLIAPGERYDLLFVADNPGVWMAHCHIENHAANGMMTVIQYEGVKPSGPIAEFWALTPTVTGEAPPPDHSGEQTPGAHNGHGAHAGETPTPSPTSETAATGTASLTPTPSPNATDGGTGAVARIAMEDDHYDPKLLTIKAGTTVTWVNTGANWHSVAAFDGSFESPQISPGESFTHIFTIPGTYKYICKHHGRQGMIGQIIVTV